MAHPDRTINILHDPGSGRRCTVRIEHTVHAEVAVMFPFPVIAAIGIGSVRVQDRMVHHLPDTASHQVIISINLFPVAFCITWADPHCMRIFAQKIRSVAQLPHLISFFSDLMHSPDRRIHLASHIIGFLLRMDRALIVNRKLRMFLQIIIHPVGIVNPARFISEAPHNHGHVSLVTLV